jgi:hypothetical protein
MRNTAIASVLTLALTSLAAHAHHGWGSYDASNPLTIEAPIEGLVWQNPHGELTLTHDDQSWRITLAPLSRLQVRGLSREMLQPGTVVAAQGYPSRRNPNEMRAERLTVAGRIYPLR